MSVVLGVDVGTSSTKGVLVGLDGTVLATAVREHDVSRPRPGHVEMDPAVWWQEFASISRELTADRTDVVAVGVSGMGPCVALTTASGEPVRPAILYGVDTRATEQIARLSEELGDQAILDRCGSVLSTQAAGPKIAWVAEHEPDAFAAARRLFMPASWLAWNLTGEYVLDHHSASQCTPLYDSVAQEWFEPWARPIVGGIDLPRLVWADTVVGTVTAAASEATGLPAGIPVIAGTIDAWTEAVSVGAHAVGDLMLMYGTTMFLVCTVEDRVLVRELWGTVGAFAGTRNLAGGMATSGAITAWLRDLVGGADFATLAEEAEDSGPGARGLLMLPYFAGERTPIADPDARGVIAGLTVEHTRGDLYRAALEATAFGVRHNVAAMRAAGAPIERIVAVGGGAGSDIWPRIVSDVTGLTQHIPRVTIGASFGAAFLAAGAVETVDIAQWNPADRVIEPDPARSAFFDERYRLYRELYESTSPIVHALAASSRDGIA